ncbi:mitochondrial ornithine transporter 1-like [Ambystoma mexicanum]|uniref:mitochondrial ornithine transporter 1-like n=1 Tax=Ambystoma mexicanum TaxID=8296 RepID=UPI0037E8AE15
MSLEEPHVRPAVLNVINMISGAMGGVACVVTGQPFDTMKVKMQTFPTMYRNFMHCTVSTYRHEGIWGLYQGTTPALLANVAENAVLFTCYGFSQQLVTRLFDLKGASDLGDLQKATAGSISSIFSSVVLCPTELVKCRMQALHEMKLTGKASMDTESSTWSVVRSIFKSEGVPGFFQGMTSTWLREVPGYFFFFGGYEVSRTLFTRTGQTKENLGAVPLTVSGGIGGGCFWLAVYPIDSVKSRIQVLSMAGKQKGFFQTLLHIIRHEGFLALYSGLAPTVIRAFPSNGALFLAYEMTRKALIKQATKSSTVLTSEGPNEPVVKR